MSKCGDLLKDRSFLQNLLKLEKPDLLSASEKELLNTALDKFISEKRPALMRLANSDGGADCFFHIAKLFVYDLKRITGVGTFQERMRAVTLRYQPPLPATEVMGYAAVINYFMKQYLSREPNGPYAEEAQKWVQTSGG